MSGSYHALFPQEHEQFEDYPIAAATETLPPAPVEGFVQTPTTGNIGSTESPHFEAVGFLSRYVGLTRPQLELLARPPALYAYHLFLNQVTRSEVAMDYTSQQMTLREPGRSPLDHWPNLQHATQNYNDLISSDTTSRQPRIPWTAGPVSHSLWRSSMPSHSGINVPHEVHAQTSYPLTGIVRPQGSPPSAIDHPTPSTPSGGSDSDQQSSNVSFNEASELNDRAGQHYSSPQSTHSRPTHPQHDPNHTPCALESPEEDLTMLVSLSQHSDRNEFRWINSSPALLNPNKGKKKRRSKTPCPKCRKGAFENRHEFVKHMIAVHERPMKFVCNHRISGEDGEQYCCSRSEWHFSAWAKHHTQRHEDVCKKKQSRSTPSPECRQEIVEQRPVRHRGCWLCNHLSPTVEHWVDHHLNRHKACSRSAMSQTWAMKSLLSHPDITLYWQMQIRSLEVTTGYLWDLKWPNDSQDTTMAELITCLETGFFKDKDFHKDSFVRAQVAEAAMDATIDTRERIATIPAQQLRELEAGLNGLRQNLAMAARAEIHLSSSTRQVQHDAFSSGQSLYMQRDSVVPWLQAQRDRVNLHSAPFEFNLVPMTSRDNVSQGYVQC